MLIISPLIQKKSLPLQRQLCNSIFSKIFYYEKSFTINAFSINVGSVDVPFGSELPRVFRCHSEFN